MRAWSMMGRQMDWQALPIIVDLLGVTEPDLLVDDLLTIRAHVDKIIEVKHRGRP